MMKYKLLLFLVFFVVSITACKQGQTEKKTQEQVQKTDNAIQNTNVGTNSPADLKLTPMPGNAFKEVYLTADYMDILFENLPFSMSQDNNASIRQILNYVDNRSPQEYRENCVLFGQLFLQKEANDIMQADIFHSEGCYYFLIKHQDDQYLNGMTDAGIQFFNQLKNRKF